MTTAPTADRDGADGPDRGRGLPRSCVERPHTRPWRRPEVLARLRRARTMRVALCLASLAGAWPLFGIAAESPSVGAQAPVVGLAAATGTTFVREAPKLRAAAEAGMPLAQYLLGAMAVRGTKWVARYVDVREGIAWLQRAASQGQDAEAHDGAAT